MKSASILVVYNVIKISPTFSLHQMFKMMSLYSDACQK